MVQYLKEVNRMHYPPLTLPFKKTFKLLQDGGESVKDKSNLGLKSFHINENFAMAFSKNLRFNNSLYALFLKNTSLNDITFGYIVCCLPHGLKKLDLSYNPGLTPKSY